MVESEVDASNTKILESNRYSELKVDASMYLASECFESLSYCSA